MATKLSQFNIFFRRTCLLLARDRHQFAVDCCIQLACGAFFGLLYENFEFKAGCEIPNFKAPISAVFHSFRLIFGRAIISRNGLEAWMLFPERARAEHSH
jgi:hypothetical protein